MIQNLMYGIIFLKILFRAYKVSFSSTRSSGHRQRCFLVFRFSSRKSQSQRKLAKKITNFTIQFCSKNLTHFTNLNSLDNENNMLAQHSQKPLSLYKNSSKMFLFGARKNICTVSLLNAQKLHSSSTLKANVCVFP